ncbi:MAG: RnfABCDGE type electron transport complex subunit D [Candidatus Dormibacteraeota bacterium]|nr:RnfABCDGE type electron transport complex subunit D [Candidatus Dormibacteraeota bacterium]
MLARPAAWLDRAAFNPASLPDDLITGIALAPTVAAGLVIFKFPAVEMLGIAVASGIAGQLASRWIWRREVPRPQPSAVIAAIVGVALVGTGAALLTSIEIAAAAVILEVLRARFIPAIRAQVGLLAFAVIALITRGAPLAYVNPASGRLFPDPIALWYVQPSLPSSYDPVTLYVGNVAGPVFATSMLAVCIGIAWLAYARRLSFVVAVGFLAGAVVAIAAYHWDYVTHLDSGPTWFVGGLLLADRRNLPGSWAIRPVMGLSGGLLATGLRVRGYGIEAAFLTVAGVQAVMAVFVVLLWAASLGTERLHRNRRLRQRDAQLRVVKGPGTSLEHTS